MQLRSWVRPLALVGVLAVVAAACSNSSSSGGGTGGNATDCSTAPGCVTVKAGDPIEIGTLLATTGATKNLVSDSLYGVQLCAGLPRRTSTRRPGQIDGHEIKLVNESGRLLGRRWAEGRDDPRGRPQIVGVIGTSCSSASLGVADKIFSEKGITIISPSATNPALTTEGTHSRTGSAPRTTTDPGSCGCRLLGPAAEREDRRHDPRREPLHTGLTDGSRRTSSPRADRS